MDKLVTTPCVDFYRGDTPNKADKYLEEILTWSNGALEVDHDWVQWVFPSNEVSMMNYDAPIMTQEESIIFQSDQGLKDRVKKSFVRFLDFLGLELIDDEVHVVPVSENNPNPQWWTQAFNHNMLRVTRILKCLRLTGNEHYAFSLYNALMTIQERFTSNTLNYWEQAINLPLWEEHVST